MQELKFKNVTIQYDEDSVNEKKIRKHNTIMYCGTTIFVILWMVLSFFTMEWIFHIVENEVATYGWSTVVIIAELLLGIWGISIICSKQYGNPKAGMWLDCILRQKEIEVGWFNERLKFVTTNSNGSRDYSLSSFLTPMKSEIVVNDETNKQGLINVTIDITDDEKTIVTVKNVKTEEK